MGLGPAHHPAMEQEFLDARNAVDSAQKARPKNMPRTAETGAGPPGDRRNARSVKDAVKFAQVSRLSRAYAELARATAELRAEEEKLAATQEQLQKAKAEIERLKKVQ